MAINITENTRGPITPSQSTDVSTLLIEAGVNTVLDLPNTATPEDNTPNDTYNERRAANDKASPNTTPQVNENTKRQENPFQNKLSAENKRGELRKLGSGVNLDTEIEFSPDVTLSLNGAELSSQGKRPALFNKVRRGSMLLLNDSKAALGTLKGPSLLESTGRAIANRNRNATKEAFQSFATLNARFLSGGRKNVQAFVQQVMRESYLIQNEILYSYAEKVKFYNEQKKRVREQLNKTRTTSAQWTGLAKGADNWVSSTPFQVLELDDNGEWRSDTNTAEDVEAWRAQETTKVTGEQATDTNGARIFWGSSQLSPSERLFLKTVAKDKDGFWNFADSKNDNFIVDNIDKLKRVLPKMTEAELKTYLKPALEMLTTGNMNEEAIVSIKETLTPLQRLWLVAAGPNTDPSLIDYDANALEALGVGTLGALGGAALAVAGSAAAGAGLAVAAGAGGGIIAAIGAGAGIGAAAGLGVASAVTATVGAAGALVAYAITSSDGLDDTQKLQVESVNLDAANSVARALGIQLQGTAVSMELAQSLVVALKQKFDVEQSAGREGRVDQTNAPRPGDPRSVRTIEALSAYMDDLEEKLNSLGDDAQLANVDLQNALQKQQQTMQMMSNISKMLHDTALSIIRKIGG